MRIAFISYEFPPDTAFGGIATYVDQASRMLAARGHQVEVFTASDKRDGSESRDGVFIHRVLTNDRRAFAALVAPMFAERHRELRFDVLEGPDCMAEASVASDMVPDVPLVVKLHTGISLIEQVLFSTLGVRQRLR